MKPCHLFFALLIWIALSARSQAQIVTDRPDQTESSLVVPKGALQIEAGLLTEHQDLFDDFSSIKESFPTILFRYGISNKFELRLVSEYVSSRNGGRDNSVEGFGDTQIGFKWNIKGQESGKTQIGFMSHLVLPTGSAFHSNKALGVINKLAISQDLAEDFSWGLNVGYDYLPFEEMDSKGNITYSLAIGHGINDKVGIFIEPYGELEELEEFVFNVDAGITYLINPNFQLDFSLGTGVTHNMNFMSIGFSWLILKK